MATSVDQKTKRAHAKTKATKAVNHAIKMMKDDFTTVIISELGNRIENASTAVEDLMKIHESYVGTLEEEGKSHDEIQTEIDSYVAIQQQYDVDLDKLNETLMRANMSAQCDIVQGKAELWLTTSNTSSSNYFDRGSEIAESLAQLAVDLKGFKDVLFFRQQLTSTKALSEKVNEKLFETSATSEQPVAPAAKIVTAKPPPPYKTALPTFNGSPMEFHSFHKRFTKIMETHDEYYTDADKVSILAESMKCEDARQTVLSCQTAGYTAAMEELRATYGRRIIIYPMLVEQLTKKQKHDYSYDGVKEMIMRTDKVLMEMDEIGGKHIETLAVALAVRDMDTELKKEWLRQLKCDDRLSTLSDLKDFAVPLMHNLEKRKTLQSYSEQPWKKKLSTDHSASTISTPRKSTKEKRICPICKNGSHPTYHCRKFKEAAVSQRLNWVRQHKLCNNCLHHSHTAADCTSTYKCRHCEEKHNYLLHQDEKSARNVKGTSFTAVIDSCDEDDNVKKGFIYTALVVLKHNGNCIPARAALDGGSTHTIITETIAQDLKIQRKPMDANISGAVSSKKLKHYGFVHVSPVFPSDVDIRLSVCISSTLPASTPPDNAKDIIKCKEFSSDILADSKLGGHIDIIIGTHDLYYIHKNETKVCTEHKVLAMNTVFGWSLCGPGTSDEATALKIEVTESQDSAIFQRMYSLETVPQASTLTAEEESAVQQFNETVQQHPDGRYSCVLPKYDSPPPIGDSLAMAKARFLQNERKMKKCGMLPEFNRELDTYHEMDHCEVVPMDEIHKDSFYLPVQGIIKLSSTTTKVRPVFDGSAKSTSGHSINEIYLTGPNLYPLTSDILLKFRTKMIGLTADISKMYREVRLDKRDMDNHRFIVRDSQGRLVSAAVKFPPLSLNISAGAPLLLKNLLNIAKNSSALKLLHTSKCMALVAMQSSKEFRDYVQPVEESVPTLSNREWECFQTAELC